MGRPFQSRGLAAANARSPKRELVHVCNLVVVIVHLCRYVILIFTLSSFYYFSFCTFHFLLHELVSNVMMGQKVAAHLLDIFVVLFG